MRVTDEAKLIAVRKKLIEAETRLYEASKILAYIFEGPGDGADVHPADGHDVAACDPVTGLYPGQKRNPEVVTEEAAEECET